MTDLHYEVTLVQRGRITYRRTFLDIWAAGNDYDRLKRLFGVEIVALERVEA